MKRICIVILILAVFLLAGCGQAPQPAGPVDDPGDNGVMPSGPTMGRVSEPLAVDGLSAGYRAAVIQVANTDIYMAHDGSNLFVYLETEGEGWVSVGFNTTGGGMNGANMIIGHLDNDSPAARDDVGKARSHSEASVSVIGDFYFAQENGKVIMEFSYPLSFQEGEGYSLNGLEPGETYTLIVAANSSSNDVNQHNRRGAINFIVEP